MKGKKSERPSELGGVPVIVLKMTFPLKIAEICHALAIGSPMNTDEEDSLWKKKVVRNGKEIGYDIALALLKNKAIPAKTYEEIKCIVAIEVCAQFEPEKSLHIYSYEHYSILPMDETDKIVSSMTIPVAWSREITKVSKPSK